MAPCPVIESTHLTTSAPQIQYGPTVLITTFVSFTTFSIAS